MIHLTELRKKRGLLQKDMAEYLGVSRVAYTNYENGNREPDLETVKKLAEYFDVSVDYLLGRTDIPDPPVDTKKAPSSEDEEREQLIDSILRDVKTLDDDALERFITLYRLISVSEDDYHKLLALVDIFFPDPKHDE